MNREFDHSKAIIEAWHVLLRYRWRFFVPAFLGTVLVLAACLVLPRKYHAQAIFDRRTDMVLTEMRNAPTSFQDPRSSVVDQLAGAPAIAQLRTQLDPLLDEHGLIGVLKDREEFYSDLHRRLIVTYDVQSPAHDRIRVEYTGSNPMIARFIVNTLVQNYIDRQRAEMDARLERSAEFFRAQVNRFREMIEECEAQRLAFEMKYDRLLPDNPNSIETLMMDVRMKLDDVVQRHHAAVNTQRTLEEELARTPETVPHVVRGRNPDKLRIQEKIRQAENELSRSVTVLKMTERHPDLVALRTQIAALERELQETPDDIVLETQHLRNTKRNELELRLAIARAETHGLEMQKASLEAQLAKLNEQAGQLHPVRADYRKLTREVDEAQRRLNVWEESLWRVEMARTAESGDRGVQFTFIKPCGEIHKPVSPALYQAVAAAIIIGMLSGALCVFLAHRTDETISDGDQLLALYDLPVFGCVSEIITRQRRRLRKLRNLILYPVNAVAMTAVILAMMGLLYLDLERPAAFEEFKANPGRFLRDQFTGDSSRRTSVPVTPAAATHFVATPDTIALSQE